MQLKVAVSSHLQISGDVYCTVRCHHFPPVTAVIQNENRKSRYLRKELSFIELLNTKNVHPAEIHSTLFSA